MTWWMWIEVGAAALVVGIGIFFLQRRFRRYGTVVAVSPPLISDPTLTTEPTKAKVD